MKKFFSILLLFTIGIFISSYPCLAQSPEDQYKAKQQEIEALEKKVSELQNQEKDLTSKIILMDSQIKLTTLKINQTQEEINLLTQKIGRLEVSLDNLAKILGKRIAETYKKAKIDSISLIFSTQKFADFLTRYKYLKVMQVHDRKLMVSMEETRTNYDDQKKEVETLKAKLETQKKLLAQQKKDKENLLIVTKNDEKRYRDMLAQARAEQAAIERIIAGYGQVAKIGPIKAGETVGAYISGASACSSGTHLHFELVKNGNHENPANYLRNISMMFEKDVTQFTPSGSWEWPIFEPIRITQEYGSTFWSRLGWYRGGIHTGIDMVSGAYGSPGPRTVRAVRDGTLNRGSIACGGGTLRYARVDQDDGVSTYYLHLD